MPLELDTLNDAQRDAVTHPGGPCIVLAGPGTGKTRVLTSRVAWLAGTQDGGPGLDPARILALTFTNKAAGELRERIADLLSPAAADAVNAYTFNAFGARLLTRFADLAGLPPKTQIIDSAQRKRLMRAIAARERLFPDAAATGIESALERAADAIRRMHNAALTPGAALAKLESALEQLSIESPTPERAADDIAADRAHAESYREAARLWSCYDAECLKQGLIGFDDQISRATALLRSSETARAICRRDYAAVLVDEFQDVNAAQIALLEQIAPPARTPLSKAPNITVVGDDDQSIYGFRGADELAFARFADTWGPTDDNPTADPVRTIALETNYRSAPDVLTAADAIISAATSRFDPDKTVRAAPPKQPSSDDDPHRADFHRADPAVELVRLDDWPQDAGTIAVIIAREKHRSPAKRWSDFAVIARTKGDLGRVRLALEAEGIPVAASKPAPPSEDPAVQDVLAWIEALLEPSLAWPVNRLLRRPPIDADPALVLKWVTGYDAARRALERAASGPDAGSPDADPLPGDGSVIAWVEARATEHGDPDLAARVRRLAETYCELREQASHAPAHEVIRAIVSRADPVHSSALPARERAASVRAVLAVLAFARERAPRLEEPGDLRAFHRYRQDLDGPDADFAAGAAVTETPDPDSEPGDAGRPNAVSVVTAHASKGLEFDTVFLPRVSYQGFPGKVGGDDDPLPAALALPRPGPADPDAAEPDEKQRHYEEERRVFYVAMTRAERRLVLLGKLAKKPSGVSFAHELLRADAVTVERTAVEIIESAADAGVAAALRARSVDDLESVLSPWQAASRRAEIIAAERRRARRAAADALDLADRAHGDRSSDGPPLDVIAAAARSSAGVLSLLAVLEQGEDVPAWANADPHLAAEATRITELLRALKEAELRGAAVLTPMRAPVTVSYTDLSEFDRCPRCWYLRRQIKLPEAPGAAQVVGRVVHAVLERFVTDRMTAEAEADESLFIEASADPAARLRELGNRFFHAEWPADQPVDYDQLDTVQAQLARYAERLHDESAQTLRVEGNARFTVTVDGHDHAVIAKIDRIDLAPDGTFRIIDYKTGRETKSKLRPDKKDLQLGVYALAARAYFGSASDDGSGAHEDGPLPGTAEYWILPTGNRGVISLDELASYETKTLKAIEGAIAKMVAGEYERGKGCWGLCDMLGEL